MANLFERAACFTDIHYGLKQNSRQHLIDCDNYVTWFIEEAKAMAKIIEDQATKLESIRLKEEELENMPILDPEKWEEYESNKVWKADLDAESY